MTFLNLYYTIQKSDYTLKKKNTSLFHSESKKNGLAPPLKEIIAPPSHSLVYYNL